MVCSSRERSGAKTSQPGLLFLQQYDRPVAVGGRAFEARPGSQVDRGVAQDRSQVVSPRAHERALIADLGRDHREVLIAHGEQAR